MGRPARRTNGQRALVQVLEAQSQAAVAETLGVSQQSVSLWARGITRPNALQRWTLEQRFGIKQASWLTAHELRATGAQ